MDGNLNQLIKILLTLTFSLAALVGCTKGLKPNDPDVYRTKTGIIGVFRQSAFYCENVMPQYITLGAQKVIVKPGWSNEQDNLFISEMKPGVAPLYSYEYACGIEETSPARVTYAFLKWLVRPRRSPALV